MKGITNFLTENKKSWESCVRDQKWRSDSMFICLYPDDETYGFMSKEDIEHLDDYYSPADDDIAAILALKPGESFSADNNIHYVRIKK